MDYYQEVVADYISADRSTFVSGEYLLEPEGRGGRHWYIDILAVSVRDQSVYLCEVTFNKQLSKIVKKVREFHEDTFGISQALEREAGIPRTWTVRPWLFVPRVNGPKLVKRLAPDFTARITYLEDVGPWMYPNGWRDEEPAKPYDELPAEYQ